MFKGKSKLALALLVVFSLVALVPVVMADEAVTPGNGRAGAAPVQLTEEQKQQLIPLWEQIRDTQKQIVQKKVELGVFTQEQADAVNERMEARHQNKMENACGMGFGAGQQNGQGKGQGQGRGMGMKRGGGAGSPYGNAPTEQTNS